MSNTWKIKKHWLLRLTVAALISLTAYSMIPVYIRVVITPRMIRNLANGKQIALSCSVYGQDHHGQMPAAVGDLVLD